MSFVQAHNLSKSYQGKEILSDLSFAVEAGDRIGLVGQNGSGKTTLLHLISGRIKPDSGEILRSQSLVMSYLEQRPLAYDHGGYPLLENPRFIRMEKRLRELEALMAGGGAPSAAPGVPAESSIAGAERAEDDAIMREYSLLQEQYENEGAFDYSARLARNLAGLGLSDSQMRQPYDTLSGGEQMRVSLGRFLLEPSDLMLFDEPTNHLDLDGLEWLQEYLHSKRSAMIIVSHDRWFLDQVCEKIFELENRKLYTYQGNYTKSRELKRERDALLGKTLDRLREKIAREQEVTQTMLSHRKMSSYHSREKVVRKLKNELDELRRQKNPARKMVFSFLPPANRADANRVILETENLAVAYDRPLFSGVSLTLKASDKIAIVGANGCGKTTLMRIMTGRSEADEGSIRLFGDPAIALMGQMVAFEDDSLTVYEYLSAAHPDTETAIRNRLAQFGFREEAMVKKLSALSGGERHRLYLCALLEQHPDILFLDEPTNHLDIESRQLLEEALREFAGAVVTVSHDRYFIQSAANSVLGFIGTEVRPFDTYEEWFACRRRFLEEQSSSGTGIGSAVPLPGHRAVWRKEEASKHGHYGALPGNAVPPVGNTVDERRGAAAEARRERAQFRQKKSRLERRIGELEKAGDLFENADPTSHTPGDYEIYANQLLELEALYEEYFALVENEI